MTSKEDSSLEKVKYLNSKLGPTLVAAAIGIRNRQAIIEVEENLAELLSESHVEKLDVLIEIWNSVSSAEGDDIARAWFIGANPWLNDESAISAIREDWFNQVRAAAQAMVEDTPSF